MQSPRRFFRWLALVLLGGAITFSMWGSTPTAQGTTTCGRAGWGSTTVPVVSYCYECEPGTGPEVSVWNLVFVACEKP